MFYVVCYLYAPIYEEKFQVGVNLLGNKHFLILILIIQHFSSILLTNSFSIHPVTHTFIQCILEFSVLSEDTSAYGIVEIVVESLSLWLVDTNN